MAPKSTHFIIQSSYALYLYRLYCTECELLDSPENRNQDKDGCPVLQRLAEENNNNNN